MPLPRPRFTMLRLMMLIALVAFVFAFASLVGSTGPTATVEFVNRTNRPAGRVEVDYPGGRVRLDDLALGEITRRRVRASQVFPPSSFNIKFGTRITQG